MMLNLPDTLITSEKEKLPAPVRELLVENRPLPAGVIFFEQRFTAAALIKRVAIAAVLFLIAVCLFFFSLEFLYLHHVDPKYREYVNFKVFATSLVFAFAGWLMLSSVKTGRAQARRQAAGERTRFGIFLLPDALVSHSDSDTTIIPHGCFRGLDSGTVNYSFNNLPKSFGLPADWVGVSAAEVWQAIGAWSQVTPPPLVA